MHSEWSFFARCCDPFISVYNDVISKTSRDYAPWHIIFADQNWYRNLAVAQIVINALEKLEMEFLEVKWDPEKMVVE